MILPSKRKATPPKQRERHRPLDLQEVLQSLRIVLEMEADHLDGAIDLLDEAIDIDRGQMPRRLG